MIEAEVQLYGAREALAELRRIDPKLRREAVAKVKAAGAELTGIAAANYPGQAPMRGWSEKGRLGYNAGKVQRGVKVEVGGRTPRGADAFPVVTIVQKDPGGSLYDIAGLRGGREGKPGPRQRPMFDRVLTSKHGPAQRGLWRSVKEIRNAGTDAIVKALESVAAQVNRKLVA